MHVNLATDIRKEVHISTRIVKHTFLCSIIYKSIFCPNDLEDKVQFKFYMSYDLSFFFYLVLSMTIISKPSNKEQVIFSTYIAYKKAYIIELIIYKMYSSI